MFSQKKTKKKVFPIFFQAILKKGLQQRWSRGHKARGQGQGHKKNPRPRTAFPRTEPLEAKDRNARGQGQGPRTQAQVLSKKKKVFKNFFQAISNSLAYPEFLIGVSPALNCRGDASPPSRFSVLPTRFERWMIRRKRLNSSPNFGKKPLQFPAKTIFFGLYLILAKKHFNFRRRPLFFGVCSISATELRNLS